MIIGFLYLHIPFKISVSKGRQRHSCHGMTASLPALVWMVIEFTKAEAVDLSRKIPIWRLCYCSSAVILAGLRSAGSGRERCGGKGDAVCCKDAREIRAIGSMVQNIALESRFTRSQVASRRDDSLNGLCAHCKNGSSSQPRKGRLLHCKILAL
jgi:hypothetical protein